MRVRRLFILVFGLVILVSACQSTGDIPQVKTDTPRPTKIPTRTVKAETSPPTSTSSAQFSVEGISLATPTDSPKVRRTGVQLSLSPHAMQGADTIAKEYPGVKEEVFFGGGFGGGGYQICILPEMTEPPLIGYQFNYGFFNSTIDLCIIDFPMGDPIQLELYTPDGRLAATKQISDPGYTESIVIGEVNDQLEVSRLVEDDPYQDKSNSWKDIVIRSVVLWTPVGLPQGEWRLIASAGDITRELILPLTEAVYENRISTMPSLTIDPFNDHSCAEYQEGDTVYIAGSDFQPNIQLPLGIYFDTGEQTQSPDGYGYLLVKVFGTLISTSEKGDFLVGYRINADAPDGTFLVNSFIDEDDWVDVFPGGDNCFKVNIGNGTPTPQARAPQADTSLCPGAPVTRLKIGDRASISLVPPNPNSVREKPGRKQNRLGLLQPGERIEILAGPRCADGWIWWKVVSLETGLDGWTPEGDLENYWIVPEN